MSYDPFFSYQNDNMIYLVDDAPDYRFLVQQVFSRFLPQYQLHLFADGLELIEYAGRNGEQHRPALILLDVDMPKLSGPQTLERLKQLPDWQMVPVVMISNRADSQFVAACYQRGASSFLRKPMDLDSLKQTMETLCRYWIDMNQLPAWAES